MESGVRWSSQGGCVVDDQGLTAEQLAEAERLEDVGMATLRAELRGMARESVRRENGELLGAFEFDMRAALHRAGAAILEEMLEGRKKGGTEGRPSSAPGAAGGGDS